MSGPEHGAPALAAVASIPRDPDGPVFCAPWAARAFALAVALNERGLFGWSEWSEALGAALRGAPEANPADPEAYWRAWLAALETMLDRKQVATPADLLDLQTAWQRAARNTPHGAPVELPGSSVQLSR